MSSVVRKSLALRLLAQILEYRFRTICERRYVNLSLRVKTCTVPRPLPYRLALALCDGHVRRHKSTILYSVSPPTLEVLVSTYPELRILGALLHPRRSSGTSLCFLVKVVDSEVRDLILKLKRAWSAGAEALREELSQVLGTEEDRVLFLAGLIDGDGCIDDAHNCIEIYSMSDTWKYAVVSQALSFITRTFVADRDRFRLYTTDISARYLLALSRFVQHPRRAERLRKLVIKLRRHRKYVSPDQFTEVDLLLKLRLSHGRYLVLYCSGPLLSKVRQILEQYGIRYRVWVKWGRYVTVVLRPDSETLRKLLQLCEYCGLSPEYTVLSQVLTPGR